MGFLRPTQGFIYKTQKNNFMDQELKTENKKSDEKKNTRAIIIFVVFIIFAWYLFENSAGKIEKRTSSTMDDIYQKVASDAVQQYRIAERQGDKIQICVQAMQVSAAYLQAQNESSYRNWKDIEKIDCRQAGMPQ